MPSDNARISTSPTRTTFCAMRVSRTCGVCDGYDTVPRDGRPSVQSDRSGLRGCALRRAIHLRAVPLAMRVSRVTPFLADLGGAKNLLFVKVETDGGPHGWGECYTQADRDRSVIAHVEALARYLVGRE